MDLGFNGVFHNLRKPPTEMVLWPDLAGVGLDLGVALLVSLKVGKAGAQAQADLAREGVTPAAVHLHTHSAIEKGW